MSLPVVVIKEELRAKCDDTPPLDYQVNDIKIIVSAYLTFGMVISETDAMWAWEKYSEALCASWINLDYMIPKQIIELTKEFVELKQPA